MQTQSEGLRARVAVYKGRSLDSLTALSALTFDGHWGRLGLDVLADETYYIALDTPAEAADPGWIKLGVVPGNGTADNAAPIVPGNILVNGRTEGAFNEDPALSPTAVRQLWWRWTPEVNARMEWRLSAPSDSGATASVSAASPSLYGLAAVTTAQAVPGSGEIVATFDASPGVVYYLKATTLSPRAVAVQLVESPRQAPPSNNELYRPQPLSGASWSIPVTLGAETGDQLYWTWTAPSAGVAEITLTGELADGDALLARLNLSMADPPAPYTRWLADWPALAGPSAAETADPDGDGVPNLAELAFGAHPLRPDLARAALRLRRAAGGWQIEATLDRGALEDLYGGASLEVTWQLSYDLRSWQPGPPSEFIRQEGRFSVEGILLEPGDPPFARLAIRRPDY